jgi:hypothetical protein
MSYVLRMIIICNLFLAIFAEEGKHEGNLLLI